MSQANTENKKNNDSDKNDVVIEAVEKLEEGENLQEVLETVPVDKREKIISEVARASMYSGPIPPPELLREFDDIIPDGADRIVKMAENQSNHRQDIEKKL